MITAKSIRQKIVRYKGAATVETAIVMMVWIMITLGILGFGYIFIRIQHVTNAARAGARVAIRGSATEQDVRDEIASFLSPMKMNENVDYVPSISGIGSGVGNPVTVSVTGNNLDPLNLGNVSFMTGGQNVFPNTYTVSVTMAKEGPSQ